MTDFEYIGIMCRRSTSSADANAMLSVITSVQELKTLPDDNYASLRPSVSAYRNGITGTTQYRQIIYVNDNSIRISCPSSGNAEYVAVPQYVFGM